MKKLSCLLIATFPALAAAEEATPISFSGFVDVSVSATTADDSDDVTIGLDQVELDAVASPGDDLEIRMDLNVFPGAPVTSGDDVIEQGFVRWTPGESGVFLEAGKRNAPIGVESIDPTDMYQYSHGLLFSFATPSNLTGVFVGWEGADLMVMGWVTNDWDVASATG